MKLGIQGKRGSYSHQCATNLYTQFELIEHDWFEDVFISLNNNGIDIALLPIENSIIGTVYYTYDILSNYSNIVVIDESYLRIKLSLVSRYDVDSKEIKKVYSHPVAIKQARNFIRSRGLDVVETNDTAGSVKRLIESESDSRIGAIASDFAAKEYGCHVLETGLESNPNNYTRFIVLAKEENRGLWQEDVLDIYKVSIVFETNHEPGALSKILNLFYSIDLNLTKLESRPIVGNVWKYYFYCDFTTSRSQESLSSVIDIVSENVRMIRLLGIYNISEFKYTTT